MDDQESRVYNEVLERIRIAEQTGAAILNLTIPPQVHLSEIPADIRRLTALHGLSLEGWTYLTDLTLLSALKSLKYLNLSRCGRISDLSPLSVLSSLELLNMSWCAGRINDLRPLSSLSSLQMLDVSWCGRIDDLDVDLKMSASRDSCRD